MIEFRRGWIEEFDQEHGESIFAVRGHQGFLAPSPKFAGNVLPVLLFADGAWRENHPRGMASDVPNDSYEKYRNIRDFHQIKLERATKAFDDIKRQAENDPFAHEREQEYLPRLKAQQATIKQIQKDLDAAQEKFNRHDPRYVSPEEAELRAKQEESQATKRAGFLSKLNQIEV